MSLLNVQSRLSPGLLCVQRAGTAAPARARTVLAQEPGLQTSVIICIPQAGLVWTPSTSAPHPDTWGEEEGGRNGGGGRRIEQQCDREWQKQRK